MNIMDILKKGYFRRAIASVALLSFLLNTFIPTGLQQVYAQESLVLPAPGARVGLSPEFAPAILKGVKIHAEDPFRFDFILDKGNSSTSEEALKAEAGRLVRYFLATLTIPEKDLWVNLSPYEKNRIIPDAFGLTEMGQDLLAQDYMLKQVTASLSYPEAKTGKDFWGKVYKEAEARFGTTDIPTDTFNKVWIVPGEATVYENDGVAFVVTSRLKVMMDADRMARTRADIDPARSAPANEAMASVTREVIVPLLEKEVNEGKSFAQLRQVYHSLILAAWYKRRVKESILEKVYIGRSKTDGVDADDKEAKEKIYARYLEAFKQGAYNYIKEEYDPAAQGMIPRKYFSGGAEFTDLAMASALKIQDASKQQIADSAQAGKKGVLEAIVVDIKPASDKAMLSEVMARLKYADNDILLNILGPWSELDPSLRKILRSKGGIDAVADIVEAAGTNAQVLFKHGLFLTRHLYNTLEEFKAVSNVLLKISRATRDNAKAVFQYGFVNVQPLMNTIAELRSVGDDLILLEKEAAGPGPSVFFRDELAIARELMRTDEVFRKRWPDLVAMTKESHSGFILKQGLPAVRKFFGSDEAFQAHWDGLARMAIMAGSPSASLFEYALPILRDLFGTQEEFEKHWDDIVNMAIAAGPQVAAFLHVEFPKACREIFDSREEFLSHFNDLVVMTRASGINARLMIRELARVKGLFRTPEEYKARWRALVRMVVAAGPHAGYLLEHGLWTARDFFSAPGEFNEYFNVEPAKNILLDLVEMAGPMAGDLLEYGLLVVQPLFRTREELKVRCKELLEVMAASGPNMNELLRDGLPQAQKFFYLPGEFKAYWGALAQILITAGPNGVFILRHDPNSGKRRSGLSLVRELAGTPEGFRTIGMDLARMVRAVGPYGHEFIQELLPAFRELFATPQEFMECWGGLVESIASLDPRSGYLVMGGLTPARKSFRTHQGFIKFWDILVNRAKEAGIHGGYLLQYGVPIARQLSEDPGEFDVHLGRLSAVFSLMSESQIRFFLKIYSRDEAIRSIMAAPKVENRYELINFLFRFFSAGQEREALLTQFLEPYLFSHPEDLTIEALTGFLMTFKDHPQMKYFLYYVTAKDGIPAPIKTIAREHILKNKMFLLHAAVAGRLQTGEKRILVVHNIDDGVGDELIRMATLVQAFLDLNPDVQVTIITGRPFLYDPPGSDGLKPRHRIVAIEDVKSVQYLKEKYDVVIDHFDSVLNYSPEFEKKLQLSGLGKNAFGHFRSNKSSDAFIFENVRVNGREYVEDLGLGVMRAENVYETAYRLVAELGLPFRTGAMWAGEGSVINGASYAPAEQKWQELMSKAGNGIKDGRYSMPVMIYNPYGGEFESKGVESREQMIEDLKSIVADGYKAVITPNGKSWGKRHIADALWRALPEDVRRHCVVADEPSVDPKLLKYYVKYAQGVTTVAGGLGHLANLTQGKDPVVIKSELKGRWTFYGRGQDLLDTGKDARDRRRAAGDLAMASGGNGVLENDTLGGIDLDTRNLELGVRTSGEPVSFDLAPAVLEALQDATGFFPVVISIHPADMPRFLGMSEPAPGVKI